MIREGLERGGIYIAAVAALLVFLALCIEPLRGAVAQVSATVLAAYAAAFFVAMTCDARVHKVLVPASLIDASGRQFKIFTADGESTTVGILKIVLFAEVWLSILFVGFYTATMLAAVSGFAIVVMLLMCEYVRWTQKNV